ncbi:hypothetical protein GQ600_19367 [Phytophthora cactorum]|nr:hypothetical protein GQ600_19367 [Phytophthora cactorum]
MNIVHEFQRARHLVRQQGSKLTLAVEHVTELEHLRAEDAAKMKELREQRKLAEQAREIVSKEKMEVLKWSEQNCEKIESLEAELKNKTLEEVDRVHSKNAQEQKLHFEQCIADVDSERMVLETKLREESAKLAQEEENSAKLQQVVDGFEEDVPVFATILHLFVLVVQPLILQVGVLLAQKRYLTRENAEFAQAHDQIECIGQVLKEMIPAAAQNEEKTKERQRRRVFRRVVIAVFAMNRFQHFANSATDADHQSAYGLSAPLKVYQGVASAANTVETVSSSTVRATQEDGNYRKGCTSDGVKIDAAGHLPSSLGNLILKVVMAVNPASKELLVANTNGTFHCQALLERRRRSNKKRSDQHDDMLAEYESSPSFEEDIPTVALIRKRILALGKRWKTCTISGTRCRKRTTSSSSNWISRPIKKTQDLQDEMAALRSQTDQELQSAQQEHEAKGLEMQSKEDELAEAQAKIETLQNEILDAENRVERVELEKVSLRRELDRLKSSSIEEEEKADKSKSAARRQEEEVRSLKQAVKKVHDLYQKVSWQLEQEVQEKATLQTVVNHLRHQQEKAERELREEKIRELEKSFNDTESDGTIPTMTSKKKASFAPTIDINGLNKCDEPLTKATSRRRKCENSDVSRQNEGVSPSSSSSSSVSPVPPRVHSKKSRSLEEVDNFLTEWQQLSVSRALMDIPHSGKGDRVRSEASDLCKVSPTKFSGLPKNVSWEKTTMEKSRRRREIDKVNAVVHDYMDRIDDKLSKMYGIPPSSAIQRSTTHHDKTRDSDMEWETSLKTDEVRVQQYHSDVGSNDE